MPEIIPGWGYQDSLLVARLEVMGAFVLPVTAAWGWHVAHDIRHAGQWFQHRRNGLACGGDPEAGPGAIAASCDGVGQVFERIRVGG